ncbi:hypothetical protein ACFXTH_028523 [Malus domestica]
MQGFQSISRSLLTQLSSAFLTLQCSSTPSEVNMSFSHDMDVEYKKLIQIVNPPRVVIDNKTCKMQP